jgi:type IV secretory pathway ATPase VirB11/archaellum biosynthesis ATPase
LIGEIRDELTARIAMRAADTGHLVVSTMNAYAVRAAGASPFSSTATVPAGISASARAWKAAERG